MATEDDSTSNDEGQGEEETSKAKLNLTEENVKELISNLLLSIVEHLTKMCVLCEGDNVPDPSSIKNLMKHIYKFEKSLKKLQKLVEYSYNQSYDLGSVIKGVIRSVDDYSNPYDWLYDNVVEKYLKSANKLDNSLSVIDRLQTKLLERLQYTKVDESVTNSTDVNMS